ncbi:MAG: SLBB domain-containing protein [Candidatus Zixiibacteriota bacterium]|nr:MAG: SLBB domain-containing protein [candidate division Zixibacteria bacterium]
MVRRVVFTVSLVIVLVSLNWFTRLLAGEVDNLTPEQRQALLKKLRSGSPAEGDQYYWETPQIFDGEQPAEQDNGPSRDQAHPADDISGGRTGGRVTDAHGSVDDMPEFSELLPFGTELFAGERGNETPIDIPSAQDYVLGPGDNVIVYLWGRVEKEFNLTLDREGKVFIPQVGTMVGWGLTLEQFTGKAEKLFSKVYSDFDLTVSLGKIRSIRVFIAGEVRRPGAYTVSSLTSLFNALYRAGGPNARGSMRQIKLMRGGELVVVVDLYNLLLKGDNSSDVRLKNGDVIFVPVAGPQVAIRGEVKRSALYELRGDERALDLLQLAGNPTATAHLERVMLERISSDNEWEVLDLNLTAKDPGRASNVELHDGDRMTVYSIFEAKKNMVAVFGHVKHTGYYERNDSTLVSHLIARAQLQPYDVYYDRADLFRRYPDRRMEVIPVDIGAVLAGDAEADVLLQDRDSLHIYSIDEVCWDRHVYIEGEVNSPGVYPLYERMSVRDLIFLAGSFTRRAYRHQIEIARIDSAGEVAITHVDMTRANTDEIVLREDDHVYVRQIPEWEQHRAVTITGEVLYPGEYTLSKREETLYQLLQRAGGFTENAFPKGLIMERPTIHEDLLRQRVSKIISKSESLKEDSLGQVHRRNTVDFDDDAMNRLIIDMDGILASGGREADIVLQPGDRIHVPTTPSGISVIGAVGANGTIKFTPRKSVDHYIRKAGNFTRQADKKQTRLVKANGEVVSGRGILGKRVDIGDVLIVPTRVEKDRNLMKTLTTALTAVTGALTSAYIISKL